MSDCFSSCNSTGAGATMSRKPVEASGMGHAVYYTAAELAKRSIDDLPDELVSGRHLIYSSPATLAFNSPGAEGFGVKRAGLAVPDSVMLIVSPGCCGRNTSLISRMPEYDHRFFYLTMDSTDIVTGRHLSRIPEAVKELYDSLERKPSVVMICITCVDALLGTDMERVCRKAEDLAGIPVKPCYMYALTREGRKPPMVHVRQSLYSILEPLKKRPTSVNILGHFAPLIEDCELYSYLEKMGVKKVREISTCGSYQEFLKMAEANFNLVVNTEARYAASDIEKRLGIPSIELRRFYDIDRIKRQYAALSKALGADIDDAADYTAARAAIDRFASIRPTVSFSVGECTNADTLELALALAKYGFKVAEVFATVSGDNFIFLKQLAELSPDTRVYSNLEPTMIYYDSSSVEVDVTIGKDAAYYHSECRHLNWNSDRQPFGYAGVKQFFDALTLLMDEDENPETEADRVMALEKTSNRFTGSGAEDGKKISDGVCDVSESALLGACGAGPVKAPGPGDMNGLRKHLTPFAPDQSGAVGVLYELGGIVVICDAGGCAGNICGFDEPRWSDHKSAVFSAGLRDMDAILGRDDMLVDKLKSAAASIPAEFAAIVGTPVPAVIGTDYKALMRMTEKRAGLPALAIDADGTHFFDKGEEKTWMQLFKTFATEAGEVSPGRVGVIGMTPLSMSDTKAAARVEAALKNAGFKEIDCYGMGAGIDRIRTAACAEKNIVVSPAGYKAAKYLNQKYGTPYELFDPAADLLAEKLAQDYELAAKRILIIDQQVSASTMRSRFEAAHAAEVAVATWFMQLKNLTRDGDVKLVEESDLAALLAEREFDVIIGDPVHLQLIGDFQGTFIELKQFALSGNLRD